jgi:hypothetical protein
VSKGSGVAKACAESPGIIRSPRAKTKAGKEVKG